MLPQAGTLNGSIEWKEILQVFLNAPLNWRCEPVSVEQVYHIIAVLMGTFGSSHGKVLRLTWPWMYFKAPPAALSRGKCEGH